MQDRRYVAVDISAWMTETITLSYLKDPNIRHRLLKISDKEARKAIRDYLGVAYDDQYELWLVVSFISKRQRSQITEELSKHVDRIIEFPEIMNDLVKIIKGNPTRTREEESLQTIRALVLCGLV